MNKGKKSEYLINNLYNFIKETVSDKLILEDLDRKYKKSYDQVALFTNLKKGKSFDSFKKQLFVSEKYE